MRRRGALGKDPTKGMTRVSPGVYRNKGGDLVQRNPRQMRAPQPQRPMPQPSPQAQVQQQAGDMFQQMQPAPMPQQPMINKPAFPQPGQVNTMPFMPGQMSPQMGQNIQSQVQGMGFQQPMYNRPDFFQMMQQPQRQMLTNPGFQQAYTGQLPATLIQRQEGPMMQPRTEAEAAAMGQTRGGYSRGY